MKFKGFGWVVVLLVALSLIACKGPVKEQTTASVVPVVDPRADDLKAGIPEAIAGKIKVTPGIAKNWHGLQTLDEKIQQDIQALEGYFVEGQKGEKKKFFEMANLIAARYAVVSGKNYELMYGKDSAPFWQSVSAGDVTLEIKVATVYVSNVPGPHFNLPLTEDMKSKLMGRKDVYDAVAFVPMEIHIVAKTEKGELMHNDTYHMNLVYIHIWECPW